MDTFKAEASSPEGAEVHSEEEEELTSGQPGSIDSDHIREVARRNGSISISLATDIPLKELERVSEHCAPTGIDAMEVSVQLSGGTLTIKASKTREGLEDAPEQNVVAKDLKFTHRIPGTFWGTPESLVFLSGTMRIALPGLAFPSRADAQEWKEAATELAQRNDRLRAKGSPMTPHSMCPECGQPFIPKRKGQIYDKRSCADRAGHRRRYKGKILSSN